MIEAVGSLGEGVAGDFITPWMYISAFRPILLLSLGGLWLRIKEKKFDVWLV